MVESYSKHTIILTSLPRPKISQEKLIRDIRVERGGMQVQTVDTCIILHVVNMNSVYYQATIMITIQISKKGSIWVYHRFLLCRGRNDQNGRPSILTPHPSDMRARKGVGVHVMCQIIQ